MDEIEALTRAYAEAVHAKDPERLAALYDPDVRLFDTWAPRPFRGLAAWRASLDAWLNSLDDQEHVRVSFSDVEVFGHAEMGCLHALVTYAAVDATGEILRSMENRLTWVVAPAPGGWKIVHEHTSVSIGPDLKGVLQPG